MHAQIERLWNTHQALGFSKLLFVPSALTLPEFAQDSFELRFNTLQHTATHCNTLQHTATHDHAPHHTPEFDTHTVELTISLCARGQLESWSSQY